MSAKDIIAELPKLTQEARAAIRRRLQELDRPNELLFLHEAADSMFQDIDNEEAKNARRKDC